MTAGPPPSCWPRRSRRCSSGLVTLLVAAVPRRRGDALGADRASPSAGCCPFASGTGLVPAAAGALLIGVALIPIGVQVARMSDQAWAESAGFVRTKRAKAPKIAVESAA